MNPAVSAAEGRDRGFSFVEMLMAVALLGLATIGALPVLYSSVRGSGVDANAAGARRWIVTAGDYATSSALPLVRCATPATYQSQVVSASASAKPSAGTWALNVTRVQYQIPPSIPAPPPTPSKAFGTACGESGGKYAMQLIDLEVRLDGNVIDTLQVVKNG